MAGLPEAQAPTSALRQESGATGSRALPAASMAAAGKEGCEEGGSAKFPAPGTLIEVTNTP